MGLRMTLKNPGVVDAIAGVPATLDYRFAWDRTEIEAVSQTDLLTYSQPDTNIGYLNAGGGEEASLFYTEADKPRFVNVSGTDKNREIYTENGLQIRPSLTNSYLDSTDFSPWTPTRMDIVPNAALAPDGTPTATFLRETTDSGSHAITLPKNIFSKTTRYSASFFVKKTPNRSKLYFVINWQSGGQGRYTIDLNAGYIYMSDYIHFRTDATYIYNLGSDWYKLEFIWYNRYSESYRATSYVLYLYNEAGTSTSYQGDGSSGVYIWGYEEKVMGNGLTGRNYPPSPYIPTSGAARTISADSAIIDASAALTEPYTLVEVPEGCASVSGTDIVLNSNYTAERVMVFPTTLSEEQITRIRNAA